MVDTVNKSRRIRSFVRREGRMTDAQKEALSVNWPQYGLEIGPQPLDLSAIFGRVAPCVLEIGFGMGDSLLTQANAHPNWDFIGIEVHRPGVGKLLQQATEAQLTNLRVFVHDAIEVLTQMIADGSLTEVWLLFPDPWPKKRHHKRRIVQSDFVELVKRKLRVGGRFHMATDWEEYAAHMLAVLSETTGFINSAGLQQFSPRPESRPLTKFEKRGQRLGHGVWDLIFVKGE